MKQVFGIDFGTTCSAVVGSVISGEQKSDTRYGDAQGNPLLSAVAIDRSSGESIVGRAAWEKGIELSSEYISVPSVKTLLGTDWNAVTERGKISPTDVAEMLFRELKHLTKARTGTDMEEAVVAIPVGFSGRRRRELRSAAESAGLHIQTFVSEPTAAFIANYASLRGSEHIAVFDWGGGTLDVSILRHRDGYVYELATYGYGRAGNDIDEMIALRVHAQVTRQAGIEIPFEAMDGQARAIMLHRCERAKRAMSNNDDAIISINRYGAIGTVRVALTYTQFSDIVKPIVDRAYDTFLKAIEQAGLTLGSIDRILMTGGSSNLRPLRERFTDTFGDKIEIPDSTVWDVAEGAAALAAFPGQHLANQRVSLVLCDGTEFDLLHENEPLEGWRGSWSFGLVDTTSQARLVFGGAQDIEQDPSRRRSLEVPGYRFLQEKILLNAEVDENLIFCVKAHSDRTPMEVERAWEYARLKTCYRIPDEVEERG